MNNPDTDDLNSMSYIINVENASGQEFFIGINGKTVALNNPNGEDPMVLKNHKMVIKQLEVLKKQFPSSCSLTAIERKEFEQRRREILRPPSS